MKIFNAKKLRSADLSKLLEYAGKESVLVSFRDDCYTTIIPAFLGQLSNVLPPGKECMKLEGSTDWGNPDITTYLERRIREANPTVTGAVVVDHWRQFIKTEDTISTLYLKWYFDKLAAEISVPLIVLYRFTL
jgi:hypothetical protein